jgi:hypothetical protein
MKRISRAKLLIGAVCMAASLAIAAQTPGVRTGGIRLRYGPFSVVWPAQPQLARQPPAQGAVLSTYFVTLAPITFTLNYVRFPSPQMMVGPADFARNMTSSHPDAQILSTATGRLAGFAAVRAIYRIGQATTVAYSIQPTPTLNYVLTVAGPDSMELRARAQQFAHSFRKEGVLLDPSRNKY